MLDLCRCCLDRLQRCKATDTQMLRACNAPPSPSVWPECDSWRCGRPSKNCHTLPLALMKCMMAPRSARLLPDVHMSKLKCTSPSAVARSSVTTPWKPVKAPLIQRLTVRTEGSSAAKSGLQKSKRSMKAQRKGHEKSKAVRNKSRQDVMLRDRYTCFTFRLNARAASRLSGSDLSCCRL